MNNFKSGSGNLDFGSSDGDTEDESQSESEETEAQNKETRPGPAEMDTATASENPSSDSQSEQSTTEQSSEGSSSSSANEYPYFVRRSNVGDERDTRLEIHVRDKVADQEAEFRSELADQLDTNEVSKTDAREFALLAAFEHPERVAELMQNEGFGTLD